MDVEISNPVVGIPDSSNDVNRSTRASEATLAALSAKVPALVSGRVPVDIGADDAVLNITFPATQTVNGTVAVSNFPATQPVSGTFWQATQPVSGTFWQATQPVSGTFWQATQPVSAASLPLPSGASTEATLAAASAKLPATLGQKTMANSLAVAIASDNTAINVNATLQTGANVVGAVTQSGTWTVQPGNTANTTAWLVKESVSATSTLSNVASSATTVTLLASNANRLGAMLFNDSTAVLYVKLGATASTTSYTVQVASLSYYELPPAHIYTGIIDGIWASANGNARITELT